MVATQEHPANRANDQPSLMELFSRLLNEGTALARNEIALAKTEAREALFNLKVGLTALALAILVLIAGLMALVASAIIALAQVMEWWLAALVAGMALSILGAVLFLSARHKFLDPGEQLDRSRDALEKDASMVARRTP